MKNNRKTSILLNLSIRIILIFVAAMLFSMVPEYFRDFFGDSLCNGSGEPVLYDIGTYLHYKYCNYTGSYHDKTWHWGYRHWLFLFMGIFLSIIQIIGFVIKVIDFTENE